LPGTFRFHLKRAAFRGAYWVSWLTPADRGFIAGLQFSYKDGKRRRSRGSRNPGSDSDSMADPPPGATM